MPDPACAGRRATAKKAMGDGYDHDLHVLVCPDRIGRDMALAARGGDTGGH